MSFDKRKKAIMFAECGGKCEYCGIFMVLSFADPKSYDPPNNEATIDHLYNRDHELRGETHGERRLFIVCRKCNGEKSKVEPNKNEPNTSLKTARKLAPKDVWSDEVFMGKVQELVEREQKLNKESAKINKTISGLKNRILQINSQMGKLHSYRNLLIKQRTELKTHTP